MLALPLPLIPYPNEVRLLEGSFTLTASSTLLAPASLDFEATYLKEVIRQGTGIQLAQASTAASITLALVEDASLGEEGYQLEIAR